MQRSRAGFEQPRLTILPPEIGRLAALTKLDLRGNQLSTLPPEIGQLTELDDFNVNGNPLQGISPEAVSLLDPDELDPAHLKLWEQAKLALG